MTFLLVESWTGNGSERRGLGRMMRRVGLVGACAMALAGCASHPQHYAGAAGGRYYDSRLGVWASPRMIADGEPIPRGGGGYLVGRPYTIGGRAYYPRERPEGYSVVGTASWYGDAFHGRRTANGEIFDKNSISAAHPTLPLPSYVRVTNLKNGRSMIVRVNDRGPYHGGRVMDVSQRVAEALSFKGEGTARIRVDYIGRASLAGSDDAMLMATLRLDGGPAQLDGAVTPPVIAADGGLDAPPPAEPPPAEPPPQERVARTSEPTPTPVAFTEPPVRSRWRRLHAPEPPSRPFDFDPALEAPPVAAAPRASLPQPPAGEARADLDPVWRARTPRRIAAAGPPPLRPPGAAPGPRPLVSFGGPLVRDPVDSNRRAAPPPPVRQTEQDAGADQPSDH